MAFVQLTELSSTIVPVREVPGVDFVNAMHIYKGRFDRKRKFAQHQHVTTDDKDRQKIDWRDRISFRKNTTNIGNSLKWCCQSTRLCWLNVRAEYW